MAQTKPVDKIVYAYTQHDTTIRVIEMACGVEITRLRQDRTKDPVEDVLTQISIPYTVVPLPYYDDKFVESYRQKGAKVWLMELGGKLLAVANVPPEGEFYEYTALPREVALKVIERAPWVRMKTLQLDRPITVIEGYVPILLYAVLPIDKATELKQRAPWLKLRLLQLDGKIVEKLTGRPYDPKSEYPIEVLQQALKVIEVKGGYIRYYRSVDDFLCELNGKKVAVFNDTLREALYVLATNAKISVELVKTCNGECVEVNPLGTKSGFRISFPGTAGKLTAAQMSEMIVRGEARIYYAEVETVQTSLCP
jgi:hypothetical protein